MKCEVVSIFRDKYDDSIHREGEILDLTKKRFQEINSTPAGVLVKDVEAGDA